VSVDFDFNHGMILISCVQMLWFGFAARWLCMYLPNEHRHCCCHHCDQWRIFTLHQRAWW